MSKISNNDMNIQKQMQQLSESSIGDDPLPTYR